jgi:hypothetical protein
LPQCTPKRRSSELHGTTQKQQTIAETPLKWSNWLTNSVEPSTARKATTCAATR